jgi:hypothetical protein
MTTKMTIDDLGGQERRDVGSPAAAAPPKV